MGNIITGIMNRYRLAHYENVVDDAIAPESGISGFILDKVEDVSNFLTMGAVARIKDGVRTKGMTFDMSKDDIVANLADQYSTNVAAQAEKKAAKQQKAWAKLEAKMDKLSKGDTMVDTIKQRAANAMALVPGTTEAIDEMALGQ